MSVVLLCFKCAPFIMENSFSPRAYVSNLLNNLSTDTAAMGTPVTQWGATGDRLRYLPSYILEEYIRLPVPKIDARQLAIVPTCEVSAMLDGFDERATVFAGWFKRW